MASSLALFLVSLCGTNPKPNWGQKAWIWEFFSSHVLSQCGTEQNAQFESADLELEVFIFRLEVLLTWYFFFLIKCSCMQLLQHEKERRKQKTCFENLINTVSETDLVYYVLNAMKSQCCDYANVISPGDLTQSYKTLSVDFSGLRVFSPTPATPSA